MVDVHRQDLIAAMSPSPKPILDRADEIITQLGTVGSVATIWLGDPNAFARKTRNRILRPFRRAGPTKWIGIWLSGGVATHLIVWRVILDVDNALAGERDETPTGWLSQLRRLRNQVAHQDTLARHHTSDGPSTVGAFGGRNIDAFTYLARACDACLT